MISSPWLRLGCLVVALVARPVSVCAQDDRSSDGDEEILGASAAFDLQPDDTETVWIPEGSPLFEHPDASSKRLEVIDALTELPVLETHGDWRKVRYGTRLGWIRPDLPWKDRVVPIGESLDPLTVTIPGIDVESLGRLELARQLLGVPDPPRTLGPYQLLTDVEDEQLLVEMDRVAAALETSYAERFGLHPDPPSEQTIALFASEDTYRRFEQGTTDNPTRSRQGHAIGDLASLFIEKKQRADTRSLFVHELTHLLNRRTLGRQPPAWIEEGLANDLAYSRVGRDGRLRPGTLAGSNEIYGARFDRQVVFTGGLASLSRVLRVRLRRQGTPLDELVDMEHEAFMEPGLRQLHYAESAFLVRLFLDGPKETWRAGFQRYLAEIAAGRRPSAEELAAFSESSWPRIERTFDAWLNVEAAKLLR